MKSILYIKHNDTLKPVQLNQDLDFLHLMQEAKLQVRDLADKSAIFYAFSIGALLAISLAKYARKIVLYSPCPVKIEGLSSEDLKFVKQMGIDYSKIDFSLNDTIVEIYSPENDDDLMKKSCRDIKDLIENSTITEVKGDHTIEDFENFVLSQNKIDSKQ